MATEAVLDTLRQLWSILRTNRIPAAVVGGLALAAWKHPRSTLDVEVLLLAEGHQLTTLIKSLRLARFAFRREPPAALGETELLQLVYAPPGTYVDVPVDLLLARSADARETLQRRVTLQSAEFGFEVQVLSCEDLIVMKLLAGRIIDRSDAANLLRANATVIDEHLLNSLVARLDLARGLAEIRREAFG
jgi:hypothetical protein